MLVKGSLLIKISGVVLLAWFLEIILFVIWGSNVKDSWSHSLQFIFLSVFIAGGVLFYIYIIIKPMKRLLYASKAAASGDLSQRIPIFSGNELGEVGISFNGMAQQLETAMDVLNKRSTELESLKVFLDSIIDNLPFNIYVIDRDLTVIAWNKKREDGPFGINRNFAIGKKLWHILDMNLFKASSPKGRAEMEKEFAEVFNSGKIIEREEVSTSFGGKSFFKIIKVPLMIKEDGAQYVLTAIEDITIRRQLEIQLMAKNRLAAIGELAAGVAHEINNPMASMAVCVESLLRSTAQASFKRDEDSAKFNKYLKIIEREIYRCKDITTGLLNFSRDKTFVIRDVTVKDTLFETIKLLQLQEKYRSFKISTDIKDNLPSVSADEGQLRQVFLAIMINAFEAMASESGALDISATDGMDGNTRVVRIAFKDNGCGIPKENLSKIFTTFFTTKGNMRTGLGLSICYGIVTQHGGRIEVESKVGSGSIFTVILPHSGMQNKPLNQ